VPVKCEFSYQTNSGGTVKSPEFVFPVIPANAGIQYFQYVLDAGVRRDRAPATFCSFIKFWQAFPSGGNPIQSNMQVVNRGGDVRVRISWKEELIDPLPTAFTFSTACISM
jgi:hypothetical protein